MSAAESINFDRLYEVIPGLAGDRKQEIPPAPEWPSGVFPPVFDRYISASSHSIRVPYEMVGMVMLVGAGAMIGNRLNVVLKRGYVQYATLLAAVIADPGSAKTPAMLAGQWPISVLQKELWDQYSEALAQYKQEKKEWASRPKDERGEEPEEPQLDNLYTTDATMEAIFKMHAKNQGLFVAKDEILGLVGGFNKYRSGKGDDEEQLLSLWSHAPIKSDRSGDGTKFIPNPVIGVYGGIQPDMLPDLQKQGGKRNGWIERFLLYMPDVEPMGWTDEDVDPVLLDPLVKSFRRLRAIGVPGEHQSVHMSREARRVWTEWYDDNARSISTAKGLRRGFYSKLPNQVARIALVLNTLWNLDDPLRLISEQRMLDAIAVGEFFRAHLDRVLPLIGDTSRDHHTGLAGRIMRILKRESTEEAEGWVRRSVVTKRLGNVQADDLTLKLEELEAEGAIERRTIRTSTRPAEEWRIRQSDGPDLEPGEVMF